VLEIDSSKLCLTKIKFFNSCFSSSRFCVRKTHYQHAQPQQSPQLEFLVDGLLNWWISIVNPHSFLFILFVHLLCDSIQFHFKPGVCFLNYRNQSLNRMIQIFSSSSTIVFMSIPFMCSKMNITYCLCCQLGIFFIPFLCCNFSLIMQLKWSSKWERDNCMIS